MATAATTSASTPADASNPASLPADAISYEDLYARWERGNWQAMELDCAEDARQWREDFTEFERTAALWNYSLFFWGEDAVADNLSPYIDAAPLEEQKYFLTTQQVDEARHAVFFKRFMQEVCGIGDGSMNSGLRAIKPQLTPGFRKIFDRLDRMADELRADRSPAQLAAAVTLYHIVIEAAWPSPASTSSAATWNAATSCRRSGRACRTSPPTSSATSASASSCCQTSPAKTPCACPGRSRRPCAT